jgi:hypothetical protein
MYPKKKTMAIGHTNPFTLLIPRTCDMMGTIKKKGLAQLKSLKKINTFLHEQN